MRVLFVASLCRRNLKYSYSFCYILSVNGVKWNAIKDIRQWAINERGISNTADLGIASDLIGAVRYLTSRSTRE